MKSFKTVITALIITLCIINTADAAVLKSDFIIDRVKQNVFEQVQRHTNGRIEVSVSRLPYSSINIPDGNLKIETDLNLNQFNSLSIAKVNVLVNGQRVKTFGVRVEVKVYDKVWVAKSWIKRGESLSDVAIEEREISSISDGALKKDFDTSKYISKRNIRPGEIIEISNIEKRPVIVKDSPVSLVFRTENISVTIPAIAVTNGNMGGFVKVRSKKFKKDYLGKVIGQNIVLVNI